MFRIGLGFDSHPFGDCDKPLKLGGVVLSQELCLKGHSDADVLLHALTDALLGAIGEDDIGQFFPPNDPRYKNADSALFLKTALGLLQKKGFEIVNVDCVIICDKPKIAPHKEKIKKNLSHLLGISPDRVNLKGKTTEGFCSSEGITVICNVLVKEK
jgi:2-C-methyl-D-erythritol 2,4-cyclodiphosphate synthase